MSFIVNLLRSFSIQLKFPRGQKILPDFRNEHAQSWHLKNRDAEKDERKKSWEFSTFLADFQKKLSTSQIHVKRNETFWKMVADNVKTAFWLPGGVNEDLIRNLIWQHHQQQQHQKISTNNNKMLRNWHQVFRSIHRKRP